MLKAICIACTIGTAATSASLAQDILLESADKHVTVAGGLGILALEGRKHVFLANGSPDNLSLLIWESTAPVLTTSIDVEFPSSWSVSADVDVALGGDSYMEDYDWMYIFPGGPTMDNWSHRSKHRDTSLDWVFDGALRVGYDVAPNPDATVNVFAGLEYTDVQWTAYSGSFIYSTVPGGFRDLTGTFSGRSITYRQQLPGLVAGLDSSFERDRWTVDFSAKGGVVLGGRATDHHWKRDLKFVDNVFITPIAGASATVEYEVSNGLSGFVGAEIEKVFLGRADTDVFDIPTGAALGASQNTGGGELLSARLSVGVNGSF